jgi:hypothetical protein
MTVQAVYAVVVLTVQPVYAAVVLTVQPVYAAIVLTMTVIGMHNCTIIIISAKYWTLLPENGSKGFRNMSE